MAKEFKVTPEMIKDIRNRHRISQVKLAESLFHVKEKRISDWECGKRNCPAIIYWAMKMTWDHEDIWGQE